MHDQIKKNLAKLNIDINIKEKSKTRGADAKCMHVCNINCIQNVCIYEIHVYSFPI